MRTACLRELVVLLSQKLDQLGDLFFFVFNGELGLGFVFSVEKDIYTDFNVLCIPFSLSASTACCFYISSFLSLK